MHSLNRAAAVVGVGATTFGRLSGNSAEQLGAWALDNALSDAGLTASDVDGLIACRVGYEAVASMMGLRPRWVASLPAEGRMTGPAIQQAVTAIAAGQCHRVALVYGNNGATAKSTYGGFGEAYGAPTELTLPYGMTSPGAYYALMLQRHQYLYGTSERQLAAIPMTFRKHAQLNPAAVMRGPLSIDDYMTSRYIVEPMRLFDYCLINDGGVAMILSAVDRAHDHPKPPVHILGTAQLAELVNSDFPPEDFWRNAVREVSETALAQSGRERSDVDALMIYDNFSCNVLFTLEGLGYCAPGESGDFVQNGRLELGGALPTNTSGGHLSESYMQGWGLNIEAVRQLRGDGGDRQIEGAETIQYACASPVVSSVIYGKDL
ncbi:thiolase family protein [Rhodococcus sp. NPDC127530]|uniref:thiolase family protein n=1 Tax=unclassified Rhodococcus (in: high G+C Gram-positive bacteria) TaxID=192944 RepID=UPI00363CB179